MNGITSLPFWSSDVLSESKTPIASTLPGTRFWSSDVLSESKTADFIIVKSTQFWSSDVLSESKTHQLRGRPNQGVLEQRRSE